MILMICFPWDIGKLQNNLGAGVVQRLCNGLPRDGPGFDFRWERCKNRASPPSQGTVNGGTVSK